MTNRKTQLHIAKHNNILSFIVNRQYRTFNRWWSLLINTHLFQSGKGGKGVSNLSLLILWFSLWFSVLFIDLQFVVVLCSVVVFWYLRCLFWFVVLFYNLSLWFAVKGHGTIAIFYCHMCCLKHDSGSRRLRLFLWCRRFLFLLLAALY